MAGFKIVSSATRAKLRTGGYKLEVVYRWNEEPYASHGKQQSFLADKYDTALCCLAGSIATIRYARDLETGRFVSLN